MKPVVIPEEANAARLRIALEHIRRAPFRVVDVPLDVSCEFLHEVIQAAFGWQSYHLWTFEARDLRIELPDPEGDMLPYGPTVDASRYSVAQALDTAGGSLRYIYDFGDDWRHRIRVLDALRVDDLSALPRFVRGKWAAPPEDCGGVPGFERFRDVMADSSDEEHADFCEWHGGLWDPADVEKDRIEFDFAVLAGRLAKERGKAKSRR